MTPYFQDESVTLYHGQALDVLRTLPDGSVDCCVTSPPYFGLRDYGVEGQHGLEASPAEYVEVERTIHAEVRRVLADDGTFWLNLGDSYYSGRGAPTGADEKNSARRGFVRAVDKPGQPWSSPKNLLGMPWRVAFALQDDGWILRNAVIWNKPNAMPESVTDRLSTRYEHLFMFSKSRRYWFDLDPIREPHITGDRPMAARGPQPDPGRWAAGAGAGNRHRSSDNAGIGRDENGRNPGDVWTIPTQPFGAAHFAVMPAALAERAIQAGCKPGGTVLDPFSGSGTTGLAAAKHGHPYIGIDLNAEYLDLSLRTRLAQSALIGDASPEQVTT